MEWYTVVSDGQQKLDTETLVRSGFLLFIGLRECSGWRSPITGSVLSPTISIFLSRARTGQ